MATPREDHTATLLADGRVLITGGNDRNGHAVASAELYDPTTGTFSPTGSMATARGFHTATLLADGRVLIVGGAPEGLEWTVRCLASAEIYDPTTGTFSPTGSMTTGGRCPHRDPARRRSRPDHRRRRQRWKLASAELYDPTTGTFSRDRLDDRRAHLHTATLLADGRVLIAGGGGDYTNLNFLASAEIYDPTTGTFTSTGSMADARTYHTATLLTDGRVLVTGGYGAVAPLASAEIYRPDDRHVQPGRQGGVNATLLADGRVLVTGGYGDLAPLPTGELYDRPEDRRVQPGRVLPPLTPGRRWAETQTHLIERTVGRSA